MTEPFADPTGDGPPDRTVSLARPRLRSEITLHAFAALLGPLVATWVVGALVATLVWRTAAIAVALTLVVRAFVVALGLFRAEWRRTSTSLRPHGLVAARFLAAFLLLVVATS